MDKRKIALYHILHHAPAFINFFGPQGEGQYCRIRLYQAPAALSEGGVFQGGRRWGKTFLVKWKAIQNVFCKPRKTQLLSVFRRPHLKNIFDPIVDIVDTVPFFKEYLKTGEKRMSVSRDILHKIEFKGRHTFYAISVGDDPHATMIKGKDPAVKFVDEAQDYPTNAASVLTSTMDPEGCEEYWAGVVDGRRDTAFFNILERNTEFRDRTYKFSRRYDPHFCQYDLNQAAQQIEGGEKGDRFGQEVDAEHGNPITGVWSVDDLIGCIAVNELGATADRSLREIIITPRDYARGEDPTPLFLKLYRSDAPTILGIDLGDVQPTLVLPFVQENKTWVCRNIIQIRDRVDTVSQKDLILYIIRQFPNFLALGMDVTSTGAIADMLSSDIGELNEKIVRVSFNTAITYGFDYIQTDEQVERYYKEQGKRVKIGDNIPLKQKTKNFSTEKARQLLTKREVLFYHHMDLLNDFTAETVTFVQGGSRIDTPPNVHIPEAFRCFAMAHWEKLGEEVKPFEEPIDEIYPAAAHSGIFGFSHPYKMPQRMGE